MMMSEEIDGHVMPVRARASRPGVSTALAFLALCALLGLVPSAGEARSRPESKFKLGDYEVKTSPALEAFTPTVQYERYAMEFKLFQRKYSACGGPKRSNQKVYCLYAAYRIGEYGTKATNGNSNLCSGQGDPVGVVSYGWDPVLRLPSSGQVSVNTTLKDDGTPAAQVKATIKITPSGKLSGSYEETDYVSTGGPSFLGCTTGRLTLAGKWDAPS
jgi:hypothetical protein